jgi:hypothetical protein
VSYFLLSKQKHSYGHHRCVTHFIGIPLFIFYYAIDDAIDYAIENKNNFQKIRRRLNNILINATLPPSPLERAG